MLAPKHDELERSMDGLTRQMDRVRSSGSRRPGYPGSESVARNSDWDATRSQQRLRTELHTHINRSLIDILKQRSRKSLTASGSQHCWACNSLGATGDRRADQGDYSADGRRSMIVNLGPYIIAMLVTSLIVQWFFVIRFGPASAMSGGRPWLSPLAPASLADALRRRTHRGAAVAPA